MGTWPGICRFFIVKPTVPTLGCVIFSTYGAAGKFETLLSSKSRISPSGRSQRPSIWHRFSLGLVWNLTLWSMFSLLTKKLFQKLFIIRIFYLFQLLLAGWGGDYSFRCQPVDYSNDPKALRMARICWLYYISKFTEFFDTVSIMVKRSLCTHPSTSTKTM